jgi:nitroimidazol reductase NimA-like FMN-containing flavoprotein (pyridoxamine 5'-phosphate oxidase superfamily)
VSDPNAEKARKMIAENIYLTLATASKDGVPWISPLMFAYDSNYNLFWPSGKDALHSQLLRSNPKVAISIFDSHAPEGTGNGVYMTAEACEVSEDELPYAINVLYSRKYPDPVVRQQRGRKPEDFSGESPRRLYMATPEKVYIIDARGHPIYKRLVDVRVEVNLIEN